MKRNFLSFLLLLIIAALSSCDKVEAPYLELKERVIDTGQIIDTTPQRIVLLEDFTGHKCVNCPEASLLAGNLQMAKPGKLVVVSIHAGFFAVPDPSGNYTADYRTPEGNTLFNYFGVLGTPTGLVNRKPYKQKLLLTHDKWEAAIDEELKRDPLAHITLRNTFNNATRKLEIEAGIRILEALEGMYNVSVWITESGIVSPQKNNNSAVGATPEMLEYTHKHMLRGSVNGTWGDPLNTQPGLAKDQKINKSYQFTLPETWNADHCSVIAFITRTDGTDEKEVVIQAAEMHVR